MRSTSSSSSLISYQKGTSRTSRVWRMRMICWRILFSSWSRIVHWWLLITKETRLSGRRSSSSWPTRRSRPRTIWRKLRRSSSWQSSSFRGRIRMIRARSNPHRSFSSIRSRRSTRIKSELSRRIMKRRNETTRRNSETWRRRRNS